MRDFAERVPRPQPRRAPDAPVVHDGIKTEDSDHEVDQVTRSGPKCYSCRGHGHIDKNCPVKGRAAPTESPGNRRATTTSSLTADQDHGPSARVEELRCTLREAELEEAISTVSTIIHSVEPDEKKETLTLGPTLTTDPTIEGVPTQDMIDTGSPVTIVSLPFMLNALAKQRPAGESLEEWKLSIRERLKPSQITLRSYSGERLNILCQTTVMLSRTEFSTTAVVYLQKDAPLPLLLGTDVLNALGCHVVMNGGEKQVDLLEDTKTNCASQTAAVRLLRPVRILARHERLVRAEASGQLEHSLALFEPAISQLKERGITMENAVIEPDAQNQITLIITNNSLKPVLLEQHEVLGNMELVVLSSIPSETDMTHTQMVASLSIIKTSMCEDQAREEELLDKLDWNEPTQSENEAQQLKSTSIGVC